MINTVLNVDDICQDCPYFFDGNESCNKLRWYTYDLYFL